MKATVNLAKGEPLDVLRDGKLLLTVDGGGEAEATTPPPEPRFMVVDVSRENRGGCGPRHGRYCCGYGWGGEADVLKPGGYSLKRAQKLAGENPGDIVAPRRPGVQFVVVGRWVSMKRFVSLSMGTWEGIPKRPMAMWDHLEKTIDGTISVHGFDLETAIAERDKILALNDRNLVDVHIVCLDMLRGEGGAE